VGTIPEGEFQFSLEATIDGRVITFPKDSPVSSTRAESYVASVVSSRSSFPLFDPEKDIPHLAFSRSEEARNRIASPIEGSVPGRHAFSFRFPLEAMSEDFTASLYIGDRIADRGSTVKEAKFIRIHLKGVTAPTVFHLTLVEKDGAAWSQKVFASTAWGDVDIPLSGFLSSRSVMLPQGYPGTWSYWLSPPRHAAEIDLGNVERIQFSLRREDFGSIESLAGTKSSVGIESVSVLF
jgi:hypothetical protein